MNNVVFISLGTNIEPRLKYLDEAICKLKSNKSVTIIKQSSIYETEPIGFENQDKFLNMVISIRTNLNPSQVLQLTQSVENDLGRIRTVRWGPRCIDLDILLFNEENITLDNLVIPHPRMRERAFVLIPLMEIMDGVANKIIDIDNSNLLTDKGVKKWKPKSGEDELGLFES